MLLMCFLLSVLVAGSVGQGVTVSDLTFYTSARGSFQFDLPRLIGPNDDILSGSVDASTLQYGSIRRVVDWTYEYNTTYARVDPNGCTDVASYTMTDNKGFSATAAIRIDIAANSAPSVSGTGRTTYAGRPIILNITEVAYDSDGDPISFTKVGAVKYATITMTSDIITYTPIPSLVNPQTGAKEAFTYTVVDTQGGKGTGIFEVAISPNVAPMLYLQYYKFRVDRNNTVMLDLQLNNASTQYAEDLDGDPLTAVLDASKVPRFGVLTTMGNGLFKYYALPGVGPPEQEVFPVTVTDGRGGQATGEFVVEISQNEAPYVFRDQKVVTLSTTPVVIAPLVLVDDYPGDEILLVNITTPKYGMLKSLKCCSSVPDFISKNITEYIYTPFTNITSEVTDNLTYTVMDQKGGYVNGLVLVEIKPYPTCRGDLELMKGVSVSGFMAKTEDFYNTNIEGCGGAFTWKNCFNDNLASVLNVGCIAGGAPFYTSDVYKQYESWICVLPSRHQPCKYASDPRAVGVTMWQNLATFACSAECQMVTKQYGREATPCDGCITCEPNCSSFNGDRVLGPEICCIGAPGSANVSKSVCGDCTREAPAPVCGSDGNTYITSCVATCQGVNVTSQAPCLGTPAMLDLTQVPDFSSATVMQLMQDGFQVYGVAKTREPPDDADSDGFETAPLRAQNVNLGINMSAASAPMAKPPVKQCAPAEWTHRVEFQMYRVSVDAEWRSKPTLAGLKPPVVEKIYNAYKQVSKINMQRLPEPRGARANFTLLLKMTYPYSAIGLIELAKPSAAGLEEPKRSYCTGWQVSSTVVVTAAHCVFDLHTSLPIKPEYLTFLPRTWRGMPSGDFSGVKAIAFPGWYASMDATSDCTEDLTKWDMAVLHLSKPLPCSPGCYLRPSIIIGNYAYNKKLIMAGYGRPAYKLNVMNASLPCTVNLLPNMAYGYSKCAAYHGHSGAPYWPAAQPYETNHNMTGIPNGVLPFSWPAFGVHSRRSPHLDNAMMCKFTAAHLKWLHRAGIKTALACTVDQKGSATCANYKYLAT